MKENLFKIISIIVWLIILVSGCRHNLAPDTP